MKDSLLFKSMLGGIISVAAFSLTAPATKIAGADFSPFAITGMRGLIAGIFCLGYVLYFKKKVPPVRLLKICFAVALIGSAGFATLLAIGLRTVSATHASVFLAMLPLFTALFSKIALPGRTTPLFWMASALGTVIAVGFLAVRAQQHVASGDLLLFISVLFAAYGYVMAARVTREIGGAATMSWIVITGSPIYLTLLLLGKPDFSNVAPASIYSLLYLGTISQALGMFLWCWSLSTGYAALVSQTQTVQPFLSMYAAGILLNESVDGAAIWVTAALIGCVVVASYAQMRIGKAPVTATKAA